MSLRNLFRIVLCFFVVSAAVVPGFAGEHWLSISSRGRSIKFGAEGITVKAVVECFGQPDVLVLPNLYPISNMVATNLLLLYTSDGLLFRFRKPDAYSAFVALDVFVFKSNCDVLRHRIMASSAIITSSREEIMAITDKPIKDVIMQKYDRVIAWGALGDAMRDAIKKESGLEMPLDAYYRPPWETGTGVSFFARGLDWEVQHISWDEPEKRLVRLIFHKPSSTSDAYSIHKEIQMRIEKGKAKVSGAKN